MTRGMLSHSRWHLSLPQPDNNFQNVDYSQSTSIVMVSDHTEVLDHDEEEGKQFIDSNNVLEEVPNDEDQPMDDKDEVDELNDMDGNKVVWEDNSEQPFPNHEKSVFAVSAHPTEPQVVAGG